jgi:hypothetical protein
MTATTSAAPPTRHVYLRDPERPARTHAAIDELRSLASYVLGPTLVGVSWDAARERVVFEVDADDPGETVQGRVLGIALAVLPASNVRVDGRA